MDNREEILARLQHWVFEEQRWTKAEFARRTGIAPQNVNKYLSGELNIENLYMALQDAGCDIHWLKTGEHATPDVEMMKILKDAGIDTPEKLKDFLKVESVVEDITAIASKLASYQRRKPRR